MKTPQKNYLQTGVLVLILFLNIFLRGELIQYHLETTEEDDDVKETRNKNTGEAMLCIGNK